MAGQRIIQLNIALLIIAGALLLSIAQDDLSMLSITLIGVTFSLVMVDWLRWIHFHPFFVNAIAFGVSFFSFTQFAGGNTGTKLNAVASLLTYLQIVLLLQRKSPRLYWQIMMLSLLQVVVAAALNLDFSAGLVFFGYVVLVVTGTIHLKIYRSKYELAESEKRTEKRINNLLEGKTTEPETGVLAFRTSQLVFRDERKITWQGLMICLFSLLFSFTVFYSVPRFGAAWHGPGGSTRQQVGFTKEIKFDDQGFVQESNRNVFRASFLDDTGKPMELAIEPYFKGLLLKDLYPVGGQLVWSNDQNKNPGRLGQMAYLLNQPSNDQIKYMRQLIRLDPAGKVKLTSEDDSHLVFSVFPVMQSENTPADLVYNMLRDILFRDANLVTLPENSPYQYEVKTPLYRSLGQIPAVPVSTMLKYSNPNLHDLAIDLNRCLGSEYPRFDSDWKEITELAAEVIEKGGGNQSRRMMCNRLVNHLRKPDYRYTRNLAAIEQTPGLDPIVDFLINHKTGHCEYFATGLALMLRSQKIPSRIVTGYYGGDYNGLGGFYQVKEKHAHVWVEAYLRPEDCDQAMIDTGQASELGAWLRLDPTPSSDPFSELASKSIIDRAFDALGFAQKVWDDYVTGLDEESRVLNGFDPTNPSSDFSWGAFSYIKLGVDRSLELAGRVRWWQWTVMAVIIFSIVFYCSYQHFRKKLADKNQPLSPGKILRALMISSLDSVKNMGSRILRYQQANASPIGFYRDFLRIAASIGFQPSASETPKEFADKFGKDLALRYPKDAEHIHEVIKKIIDDFYKCRFGQLDKTLEIQRQSAQTVDDLRVILAKQVESRS